MNTINKTVAKLKPWQVAIGMIVIGLCTFFTGLSNPFQGDDSYQIVNNPPVHSIAHLFEFFGGGTFYNGERLSGDYYRPMMSTTFSLIYSLFGAHPIAFHLVQLALYIAGTFVLYLIFKHFLKPLTALVLALIFLVHPLNSQIVYSIPTMQDALFFLFGMLAIWILIRYKTTESLWAVCGCLLLALFSKETGFIFVLMALLYLWRFDRQRLRPFLSVIFLPVILYAALRFNAIGLHHAQHAAPIDSVSLGSRLMTAPSIVAFYLVTFLFPWKLASTHFWVYTSLSVAHVLLPLLIDAAVIGLLIYGGWRVRKKLPGEKFQAYIFFAVLMILGLIPYLQIVALDMTACETWFYTAMAGLLGMIGLVAQTVKLQLKFTWLKWIILLMALLILVTFGVRSALRGRDYHSQYTLATHDLIVEPTNYSALNNTSQYLIDHQQYKQAADYAQRSVDIYPVVSNYNNLGVARQQSGDYAGAAQAYRQALKYNDLGVIYENLSLVLIVHSDPATAAKFLQEAIAAHPHDFKLWVYAAIFEGARGNNAGAKAAINNAAKFGQVPPYIYTNIMQNRPFALPLLGKTLLIH